mmetsp:Transcript_103394/g.178541  ORF Transcript_103394/g.178541 Transcript_103394/m.178541 type:complete len:345 (-) Transcript_103394:73-1107(-)
MMHRSAAAGNVKAMSLLSTWGARRDAKDELGLTPADVASKFGQEYVLDELLERPRLIQLVQRKVVLDGDADASKPAGRPEHLCGRPRILVLPRSRILSGHELYSLAWQEATGAAEAPSTWDLFELRAVAWNSFLQEEGVLLPRDKFAVDLGEMQTLAMDWQALPDAKYHEPLVVEHSSIENSLGDETANLSACFEQFTEKEELGEDQKWICPTCKEPRHAIRSSAIESLPPVLVLQLMRFYYKKGKSGKITGLIDFPVNGLDLTPWSTASQAPQIYDLFAVVNHSGQTSGGHYTACARLSGHLQDRDAQTWYKFNDWQVEPMTEESVVSRDAYMLFYRKRDADS